MLGHSIVLPGKLEVLLDTDTKLVHETQVECGLGTPLLGVGDKSRKKFECWSIRSVGELNLRMITRGD